MVHDPKGKRTRWLPMLKFFGALALPVLILGSAIAVAEWAETEPSAIELARKPISPR
ncbi:hypothetical protein NGR_c14300 [Sinorhizobium fredii NGR234]|uniref:Uncharacterized protein n=1 Tax=Sinorhizobium fredii (strain NBRC 101917 / NGR234) TaxID=394 RepID=C3MCC4_SINFN|nr:hypothetical protein NGR_c14300 [Sinorhizobium fredii NGR234]